MLVLVVAVMVIAVETDTGGYGFLPKAFGRAQ
jgi:hypothetical protein